MANSKENIVTEGLSGKLYQLVFKRWFGRTIVAKRPRTISTGSAKQLSIRSSFKNAITYAKAAVADAAKKLAYKAKAKPGQSAYNMAIDDFFKSPTIGEIDCSGYNGQVGSTVIALVTDDFKVVSVKLCIDKSNGDLLEEGSAKPFTRWVKMDVRFNSCKCIRCWYKDQLRCG